MIPWILKNTKWVIFLVTKQNSLDTYYRPQIKLRAGNIFTSVCQSFSSRKGRGSLMSLPIWYHIPSGRKSLSLVPCSFWEEVSVSGPMFLLRDPLDLDPTGQRPAFLDRDQLFGQRYPWTGIPCMAKSWWYAFYWNTFLFFKYFTGYFWNKSIFLFVWLSKKQFKWL